MASVDLQPEELLGVHQRVDDDVDRDGLARVGQAVVGRQLVHPQDLDRARRELVGELEPTVLAVAGDRFPQAGASMFSVLSAAGALGCAVAPAAIGWIAKACGSLAPALAALAVAPAIILVMSLRVTGRPGATTDIDGV